MKTFYSSLLIFIISTNTLFSQDTLQLKNIDAILYTGNAKKQPLVVGLGGSEGGNAWATKRWQQIRNQFIEKGYAFLAVGYFNTSNSPKLLEKIALEDVHNAILQATKNKKVDKKKIAIIGGSRGADLALLLGSYYRDIDCVISLSGSHAVFPGNTTHFTTSSWTYKGQELPFIPVNDDAIPFMLKRDLRSTFEAMLKDSLAEQKSLIKVERINGPVLLLSGTKDEICPSTTMSEKMIEKLKQHKFKYHFEHIAYDGGHSEPLKHFDKVFEFLAKYFMQE